MYIITFLFTGYLELIFDEVASADNDKRENVFDGLLLWLFSLFAVLLFDFMILHFAFS